MKGRKRNVCSELSVCVCVCNGGIPWACVSLLLIWKGQNITTPRGKDGMEDSKSKG